MRQIGTYTQHTTYAILQFTTFSHVQKNIDRYCHYHYALRNGDLVGSILSDLTYIMSQNPDDNIYILDAPYEDGQMHLEPSYE